MKTNEQKITVYKAILEDKKTGAIKKLELGYNETGGVWKYVTKLLNKETLETTTLPSNFISHQSMCYIVRMFFDINGYEVDSDKHNL